MTKREDSYFRIGLLILFAVIISSSIIYSDVEGYTLWQSVFYMILTVTTVGSGKYIPQTLAGEVISVIAVIIGMGIVLLLVTIFAKELIAGRVKERILGGFHLHHQIPITKKKK